MMNQQKIQRHQYLKLVNNHANFQSNSNKTQSMANLWFILKGYLENKKKNNYQTRYCLHCCLTLVQRFTKKFLGCTEIIKDKNIFQAEINYHGLGAWFNNIMVDWEESNGDIPASIEMFFS